MQEIHSAGHSVYINSGLAPLQDLLNQNLYSKIYVLTDDNTSEHCLPVFQSLLDGFTDFDLIETTSGEAHKTLDFCIGIWQTLLDFGADRQCLIINLGGGVITDMGGFIASTYKRGVHFINIPTTLLSMVDASVGGKTGVDLDHVKNMVGTFAQPQAVFIESIFLQTLAAREKLSGFAEMIKHGLIADKAYFNTLKQQGLNINPDDIYKSVQIKNQVVLQDPQEKNLRKILNFGHTIGHAVESYALMNEDVNASLTHGEAIAIGMICEAYLAFKKSFLAEAELTEVTSFILSLYPKYQIEDSTYPQLLELMQSDKKNADGQILFSLIHPIGECEINIVVENDWIIESFNYYNNL